MVGTRRVCTGALKHRAAERGKAAGIGHNARLHALNDAVFVAAHRKVHPHRVALGVDENGFLTRKLHLHRHARDVRDERRVMLHGHILFSAEAAADKHIFNLAVRKIDAEHRRALVLRGVRALVSGQELHAAVVKWNCYTALRLQKSVLRPRGLKLFV